MTILAIDPGNEESAFVHYDDGRLIYFGKVSNDEMLAITGEHYATELVIEQVASMGMAVGEEIFETVFWSGKFAQMWAMTTGRDANRIKRHVVKMHLCHNNTAKDANIRQRIIDLYGGQDKAIGGVKCVKCKGKGWTGRDHAPCPVWQHEPGLLYGIAADVWQALALAITFSETTLAANVTKAHD